MMSETPLTQQPEAVYRIREFAALAGVTVRALHHYDRLGLLKPSGRSSRGYRLYRDRDLARLEQIVVLKFLGMPLAEIGRVLDRDTPLADALRRQQRVLAEKRWQLDLAIHAIARAEQSLASQGEPEWSLFKNIVREIEMQNNTGWSKTYYSDEAKSKIEQRRQAWTPELQARVSREWTTLYADVEAAMSAGDDPTSATAQALAARWRNLVEGFTGGDSEIQKGLNRMWADQANWPEGPQQSFHMRPELQEWIVKAMRASR